MRGGLVIGSFWSYAWPSAVLKRTVVVVSSCLALMLLSAASAAAAPAWLAPLDLSVAGQTAAASQVAVDPQGNAVAVWNRSNGTNTIVQAAVRLAGGSWQAPVDVSVAGQDAGDPQVAVDPLGNAVAVWDRSNGSEYIVQAAVRPAGGSWQAPVNLSLAGQNAYEPQVAVDSQGNAVAAWRRFNSPNWIVQGAVRPAGGSWQGAVNLSVAGENAFEPQVAFDPQGTAAAVWYRSNGTNDIVQSAVRPAGGSWQAPVNLSVPGQSAASPQIAFDAQGNGVAVWTRSNGTEDIVQGAARPAGGSWQTPVPLSVAGQDAANPQLAVDAQGNAIAVWSRSNGMDDIVQGAARAAGGSWQAPVDLSAAGLNGSDPQVAFDAQGNAIAVWGGSDANSVVHGAVRAAGGSWQAPVDLSAAGKTAYDPHIGIDSQGNAVAVWQRFNGSNFIVQGAGFDGAGPLLQGLSIPATGIVGQPLSLSIAPLDLWSPLGATSWSFGDGASAGGTSVSHAYTAPGSYHVTVTSADAVANATTATGMITIGPAPTPTPAAVARLRLSPAKFRAARSGASVVAAAPRRTGTRVSYTLNIAASARFTVQRAANGRTVSGRCVKPTRSNRKRKPCTRYVAVRGSIPRTRPAGADRFTFTGRLNRRALKPGRYRLVAIPTANGRAGNPARASFRIVK